MSGERNAGTGSPVPARRLSAAAPWPTGSTQRLLLLLSCLPAILLGLSRSSDSLLTSEPSVVCANSSQGLGALRPPVNASECRCTQWEYRLDTGLFQNIVTQWNLICNSSWKVHIAKFSLLVGLIIGYLVTGNLADWVGRQLVLVISVLFVLIFGLTVALSVNVTMFSTLRFFEGFSLAGVFLTLYVTRIEISQPNQRFMITMVASFIAIGGQLLTPGLAALCRNWQILQVIIICPFTFMIPYWCVFPESLRWLLATHQLQAAKDLLLEFAHKHRLELEDDVKEFLSELDKEPKLKPQKIFIIKLKSTRILWKHILVLCVTSLAGFGIHNCFAKSLMDHKGETLSNFYTHYYVMELIGILSCVVMCLLVGLIGRRGTLLVFTILTALASLLQLGLVNNLVTYLQQPFSLVFSIVGLFSSHSMGNLSIFVCAELTPTVIRSGGLGLVMASAGFGQLTAPIMELHNQKGYFLHHIIFACCTVICIICILFLPETKGQNLPDSMEDGDTYPRHPLIPARRAEQPLLFNTELKRYSGLGPGQTEGVPTANGTSPT
ncbi:solute carrier family 22 member 23-like isoform X2 [Hemitrygon akajei]|uniref:solute carrier family 22 member 23-like isoform X2 n=1 Tax=Hemitrygon akajei TaxID=2704970 RepID=UPI003BFA0FB0